MKNKPHYEVRNALGIAGRPRGIRGARALVARFPNEAVQVTRFDKRGKAVVVYDSYNGGNRLKVFPFRLIGRILTSRIADAMQLQEFRKQGVQGVVDLPASPKGEEDFWQRLINHPGDFKIAVRL